MLLKTLALGAMGGAIFFHFRMPLAWMMGAMVICTIASIYGTKLQVPQKLRSVMVSVLGVLLGSTFTPESTRTGRPVADHHREPGHLHHGPDRGAVFLLYPRAESTTR